MKALYFSEHIYYKGSFSSLFISVEGGIISGVYEEKPKCDFDRFYDFTDYYIFPGFADLHVHFRQPGFSYKETIKTGSEAALAGGYTLVCTMPNLNPVPDSVEHISSQLDIIKSDAEIAVLPYASITVGEKGELLSDFESLAPLCFAFSDDGCGVQSDEVMYKAMTECKRLGKAICAHCEVNSLLHGGYIHDGEYAKAHGHKGICSASEYEMIKRDLELVRKTGCRYHVCHISCRESVELIRSAKAEGLPVTAETAPHYLLLTEDCLKDDGCYRMNPPLRTPKDRAALIDGIQDGTIEIIATDHAPHSAEEKSRGLSGSAFGIVGLECAFAVLYTGLVKKNIITLEKLIELMSINPRSLFGIEAGIAEKTAAELCVWDLNTAEVIDSGKFKSKGKSTPFDKETVLCKRIATVYKDKIYD